MTTKEEQGWLALMRYNRLMPRREISKTWQIGRAKITFNWRSKKNFMGRFGGGWDWKLGFQASSWRSVIVNLLTCSVWWTFPKVAQPEPAKSETTAETPESGREDRK